MSLDAHDIIELNRRLDETVLELQRMVKAVATAKQVREFNGELRKNLLARFMAPLLVAGKSAVAAEALARSDAGYQSELAKLSEQYLTAEQHLTRYDVLFAKMDAQRSALSLAKEQLKL